MKHPPPALRRLEKRLQALADDGLLRTRPEPVAEVGRSFCSNDYLGLASRVSPGAPSGAGASRLIAGERKEHRQLETALASWLGVPDVLLFSSGYAANVGTIAALAQPGDLVVSDELNHASLIDGCRLGRGRVEVVPHLELDAVERALSGKRGGQAWVVTESYFSMDADAPDLAALRRLCDRQDAALVVDEAHALGVFGPAGRGLCAEVGVVPDVLIGTLGKAFGSSGAFVAGSEPLVAWLWNRARSFVFSTGIAPVTALASLTALPTVAEDAALRARLHSNAHRLRQGLAGLGLAPRGFGPIIPLVIGDARRAVTAATELRGAGLHVQAVRPPTVPTGTARLRVTATALHSEADIDQALACFERTLPWLAPSS